MQLEDKAPIFALSMLAFHPFNFVVSFWIDISAYFLEEKYLDKDCTKYFKGSNLK